MDVWGALPKSQIDASTVDEEIDAKIVDHLDDPDAHLETGQSLQSHKASEIIDHLAGSIIEDKIGDGEISTRCLTADQIVGKDFRTATDVGSTVDGVKFDDSGIEMWQDGDRKVNIPVSGDPEFKGNVKVGSLEYLKYTIQSFFESLDGWSVTENGANNIDYRTGYLEINHNNTIGAFAEIYLNSEGALSSFVDLNKNHLFDTTLICFLSADCDIYFGVGSLYNESGIGFKVTEAGLYSVWVDSAFTEHLTRISDFDENAYHRYRVEVYPTDRVDWLVDGVVVLSIDWVDIVDLNGYTYMFYYYVKSNTSSPASLYSLSALFQQDF